MLHRLINLNPDLLQLHEAGFDIDIFADKYLLMHLAYVTPERTVETGTLMSVLEMAGDKTNPPTDHVAYFIGKHPCNQDGSEITQFKNGSSDTNWEEGLVTHHTFSAKHKVPSDDGGGNLVERNYRDYFHKMETYAAIISAPARKIDPQYRPQIYSQQELTAAESVFKYSETNTSRSGIGAASAKLKLSKVAIVGVGGTGSYILDLVAKAPVGEIHLFDGDEFLNHNAFRSPGAASIEDLRKRQPKVEFFEAIYSRMRWNVIPHAYYLNAANVNELDEMDFVFISMDGGDDKKSVVEYLVTKGIPFIEVGMGLQYLEGDRLSGSARVTTITNESKERVAKRIPFTNGQINNDYAKNIQVADLNALNAALAVIRWKRLFGYYLSDPDPEFQSIFSIPGNSMINNGRHAA